MSKNDDYAVEIAILLLRKMADKMEEDSDFAGQVLNEVKAIREIRLREARKQKKNKVKNSPDLQAASVQSGLEVGKIVSTVAASSQEQLPDIYAIYTEGREEGLRCYLEGHEVDFLKRIVTNNHLDPSGKVIKWRLKPKIINFIVDTAIKRLSQGHAFRTN